MNITIIKADYNIKQILLGKPTKEIENWIKQLNDNPLVEEEYTIETKYTDKSIYSLVEFFGIE